MKQSPRYKSIHTSKDYDAFLNASYMRVKPDVEEIELPPILEIYISDPRRTKPEKTRR